MNEIVEILEFKLSNSAYKISAWWANEMVETHTHVRSWLMACWKTIEVKPGNKVNFIKYLADQKGGIEVGTVEDLGVINRFRNVFLTRFLVKS